MNSTTCKNCNATLNGKFCANCGQKAEIHRITVGFVFHEFVHALTHADKGFLLTIKELIRRPGFVAKEYIEGKRKKYFNPLSFLVITTAVFAYLSFKSGYFESFAPSRQNQAVEQPAPQSQPPSSQSDSGELDTFSKVKRDAYRIIINDGKVLALILIVPLITIFTWTFFRRPKYSIAEHFVLVSYFFGMANVVRILVFLPMFAVFKVPVTITDNVFQLVFLVYLIVATKQFFNNHLAWTIVKSILIMGLFIASFWYSIWGYVYAKYFVLDLIG